MSPSQVDVHIAVPTHNCGSDFQVPHPAPFQYQEKLNFQPLDSHTKLEECAGELMGNNYYITGECELQSGNNFEIFKYAYFWPNTSTGLPLL